MLQCAIKNKLYDQKTKNKVDTIHEIFKEKTKENIYLILFLLLPLWTYRTQNLLSGKIQSPVI